MATAALVAGNTVIMKPAEQSSLTALRSPSAGTAVAVGRAVVSRTRPAMSQSTFPANAAIADSRAKIPALFGNTPHYDMVVQREYGDGGLADSKRRSRYDWWQQTLETLPRLGQLG